jgi:hypothetical protein
MKIKKQKKCISSYMRYQYTLDATLHRLTSLKMLDNVIAKWRIKVKT